MKNCTVAVIGDIIMDRYIWGDVTRISPEAPVPVVKVKRTTANLGGAGNVAMNLKGLGCTPILIGTRGEDPNGAVLMDMLNRESLEHHILTIPDHITTTKTRIIGQRQQVVRLDEESSNYIIPVLHAQLMKHIKSICSTVDAVIISDYGKGLMTENITKEIIKHCCAKKMPVFVDPKGVSWERYSNATCITPNTSELYLTAPFFVDPKGVSWERYSNATCITPNTSELYLTAPYDMQDESDLEKQATKLMQKLALEYLLVTRGSQGMTLFAKNASPTRIPAKAKEVFDVSGAGDTVIATITATFAAGLTMQEAAEIANKAASVVVGKIGTQPIEAIELRQIATGESLLKIVNRQVALSKISSWRNMGKKIVFTNGCFDILHVGHIKLLNAAAKEGDKLIVGLNSDASVKQLKGDKRPVVHEAQRATLLAGIKGVDLVVLFGEETPMDLILQFEPDVLVKGGDYQPETVVGYEAVVKNGGRVVIVPLVDGVSTSSFIQSVKNDAL